MWKNHTMMIACRKRLFNSGGVVVLRRRLHLGKQHVVLIGHHNIISNNNKSKILTVSRRNIISSSSDGGITTIGGGDVDHNIYNNSSNTFLCVQERVKDAIAQGQPVCALESTLIAQGMPFPENLQLAQEVEQILEDNGVIPATIAIRNGVCRVGISEEELHDLARAGEEGRAQKCSTRDLPLIMAFAKEAAAAAAAALQEKTEAGETEKKSTTMWGATTVASTMKLAHMAGISTFVTGGIGGVHRNGEISMDVSSDLTQLGQTPVVVVCAGIKSILDIQRTIEVLETNSVPTLGWQTDEFPAFFSPSSGIPCPARADSAEMIANIYWAARQLQLSQGMLVAVPNTDDPAGENVEQAIQETLREVEMLTHIRGRDVTPYILKTVAKKTGGDSLRSNMALVRQNAKVGAKIAIAISKLRQTIL